MTDCTECMDRLDQTLCMEGAADLFMPGGLTWAELSSPTKAPLSKQTSLSLRPTKDSFLPRKDTVLWQLQEQGSDTDTGLQTGSSSDSSRSSGDDASPRGDMAGGVSPFGDVVGICSRGDIIGAEGRGDITGAATPRGDITGVAERGDTMGAAAPRGDMVTPVGSKLTACSVDKSRSDNFLLLRAIMANSVFSCSMDGSMFIVEMPDRLPLLFVGGAGMLLSVSTLLLESLGSSCSSSVCETDADLPFTLGLVICIRGVVTGVSISTASLSFLLLFISSSTWRSSSKDVFRLQLADAPPPLPLIEPISISSASQGIADSDDRRATLSMLRKIPELSETVLHLWQPLLMEETDTLAGRTGPIWIPLPIEAMETREGRVGRDDAAAGAAALMALTATATLHGLALHLEHTGTLPPVITNRDGAPPGISVSPKMSW